MINPKQQKNSTYNIFIVSLIPIFIALIDYYNFENEK